MEYFVIHLLLLGVVLTSYEVVVVVRFVLSRTAITGTSYVLRRCAPCQLQHTLSVRDAPRRTKYSRCSPLPSDVAVGRLDQPVPGTLRRLGHYC